MHDCVRIAKPGAESLAQIDMGDLLGGQRVHQPKLIDIDGHASRGLADAEIVEGMEGIRPKLDACADLTKRGGLFEQNGADALLREPKRRRQAADAATRDQDRSLA